LNQGQKANHTGQTCEQVISTVLIAQAYRVQRQVSVGNGIYGTPIKADFWVSGVPGFDDGLIIESKWQGSGGSVDEKFPYLVRNIKECYPCPTIIVLGGGGYRSGAERWMRSRVGGKLLAVMSIEEFISWVIQRPKSPNQFEAQMELL